MLQKSNPTGQLSKQEFVDLYSQFFSTDSPQQLCEYVFSAYDTNRSGTIDFKEFMIAIKVVSSGTVYDKLWLAYSVYDIDGNGSVDSTELLNMIKVSS